MLVGEEYPFELSSKAPDSHTEVFMDQFVAHACHLRPGHLGIPLPNSHWHFLCRLFDNFEGADHGIERLPIVRELLSGHPFGKIENAVRCLLNVG